MPKTKTSTTDYKVSPTIQRLFIWLAVLSLFAQVATMAYWIIVQYPDNTNLSAFLSPAIDLLGGPLIMFLAAFFLVKRQDKSSRLFESLLFMTMGILLSSIINQIAIQLYQRFMTLGSGYWQTILYDLGATVVALIIYMTFIFSYRGR